MLKITLLAMGNKMPDWVYAAVSEYTKRMSDKIQWVTVEIPLIKRGKNPDLARILEKEAAQLLEAVPHNAYCVTLDSRGTQFTSELLAERVDALQQMTNHLCLIIGGPEGLHPRVIDHCQEKWSLSKLTLPHPLVRIVLAEALYRSFTIIANHPYHK